MERIVLTTGGTGGHIFPALAVAEEILQRNPEAMVLFIGGTYGQEADIVARAGYKFVGLPVEGITGRGLKALGAALAMLKAVFKAIKIMRKFNPQIVMGFGGYASFAGVLGAKICGIPTAIHEQNAFPGQSNRLLGKLVDKIFLSFAIKGFFPERKTILVGNPVRASIKNLYAEQKLQTGCCKLPSEEDTNIERREAANTDRRDVGLQDRRQAVLPWPSEQEQRQADWSTRRHPAITDRRIAHEIQSRLGARLRFLKHEFQVVGVGDISSMLAPHILPLPRLKSKIGRGRKLLVMGGSLGAKALNKALVEILPALSRAGIEIWHQTGLAQYEELRAEYRKMNLGQVRVEAFIEDMAEAYAWADIALCRAGGSSIAELAVAGVPAIFVPYPFATHNHQFHNAKYLVDVGAAVLLEQKSIAPPAGSPALLEETILNLCKDVERLQLMRQKNLEFARAEAASAMVDELEKSCTATIKD